MATILDALLSEEYLGIFLLFLFLRKIVTTKLGDKKEPFSHKEKPSSTVNFFFLKKLNFPVCFSEDNFKRMSYSSTLKN